MASHLEELAAKISAEVAKFSKTIEASDTPKLKPENATIGGIGSSVHSKAELDPSLLATKYEIASAAQTLLRLVQGPIDHIVTLSYGVRIVWFV